MRSPPQDSSKRVKQPASATTPDGLGCTLLLTLRSAALPVCRYVNACSDYADMGLWGTRESYALILSMTPHHTRDHPVMQHSRGHLCPGLSFFWSHRCRCRRSRWRPIPPARWSPRLQSEVAGVVGVVGFLRVGIFGDVLVSHSATSRAAAPLENAPSKCCSGIACKWPLGPPEMAVSPHTAGAQA